MIAIDSILHAPSLARRAGMWIAIAGLAATGLAGCQRTTPAVQPAVAARVGESVILVDDVQAEIERRVARGNLVPAKDVLLNDMIERRLLLDRAREAGLDRDPEVVRSWENLVISRYKELNLRRQERDAVVTEDMIREQYESAPDRFRSARKARLAILKRAVPPTLDADEKAAVVAAMDEARALAAREVPAAAFGPLALEYSEDDVTRHRGGDAGWLDEGVDYRWPSEVLRAGFALDVGAISDPIEAEGAVYVVKKSDERPAVMVPLEKVRDQIRRELQASGLRAVEEAFAATLRQGITIETFPERLRDVTVPMPDGKSIAAEEPPPGIP